MKKIDNTRESCYNREGVSIPRKIELIGASDPTHSRCPRIWVKAISNRMSERYMSEAGAFELPLLLSTTIASVIFSHKL